MESPDYDDKTDHEKYVYFQPGEVVFFVRHPNDQLSDQDINVFIKWGNEQADAFNLVVLPRPGEELHFPATRLESPVAQLAESSQSSLYRTPQVESHSPFTIILADVKDKSDPRKYVDSHRLADFITRLDEIIQSPENTDKPTPSAGTVLEVVSPNWLSSSGSEFGGGGGPGSRPIPFKGGDPPDETEFEFHLPPKIEEICPEKSLRGKGVIVAVLDTAPCMHDLVAAYEYWQKVDPVGNPRKRHGLIETLLEPKPNGPLTVHPASSEELLRMRSVHLKDHNYDMTDHGLFVAGIIHSIAPAAEIHLYEVLNPNGVGDLKSIALGLSQVLGSFPTQPLVVNCSLVLNIPLLNQPITDLDETLKARIIHGWDKLKSETIDNLGREFLSKEGMKWLARQGQAIEWICDLLYAQNSGVIAAAGNDWRRGQPQQPQARYPAAFESVLGVGALKKRSRRSDSWKYANYSDLADQPPRSGIVTLGGEKGQKKGVLGIYLGKFPSKKDDKPGPKNECDWAWWAGTSFASPIISGVTAAVLSGNLNLTAQGAVKAMYDAQAITISAAGEHVLDVMQGPPPP